MILKRISMFVPMVLVASFGMLASCGEKEATPDTKEEVLDAAEEAADDAGEAADAAADEAKDE